MEGLDSDRLFVGLTRPQLLLGVPFGFAIGNAIVTTELFLVFRSAWVVVFALVAHLAGWLATLRDPRIFHLWIVSVQRCPRVKNHRLWRCNSYRA